MIVNPFLGEKKALSFERLFLPSASTILLICLVIFGPSLGEAQTLHGYEFNSFSSEYEPLEDYTSMQIESGGIPTWSKKFNLNFQFPFFDQSYDSIICDHGSICFFEGAKDYSMFLNDFLYEYDIILDTFDIESDMRYALTERNGKKALVMEYLKNRLSDDPSVDEHDSYVTFQNWLYEDGTIEIRYGPSNLEHSPYYVPGEGFYLHVIHNGEPDSILYGPSVQIQHPDRPREVNLGIDGPYDDYQFEMVPGYVTTYPPEGFVFQFRPESLSSGTEQVQSPEAYPNPFSGQFQLKLRGDRIERIQLTDAMGRLQNFEITGATIQAGHLPPGMYFLEITTRDGSLYREKLIKD